MEEFIYFSLKLGINFRLQKGSVFVRNLDPMSADDDDESCTLLSGADIQAIRDRCTVEDREYCSSLDIVGYNRTMSSRNHQRVWSGVSSHTNSEAESDGKETSGTASKYKSTAETFAERFNKEKLWSYGPVDGNAPTYYINAAPQQLQQPSSHSSSHSHGNPDAAGSVFYSPTRPTGDVSHTSTTTTPTARQVAPLTINTTAVPTTAARAVAVSAQSSTTSNEDPRSPSARTPIATVVNAVPIGPIEVRLSLVCSYCGRVIVLCAIVPGHISYFLPYYCICFVASKLLHYFY
jgi:hypothetical protein